MKPPLFDYYDPAALEEGLALLNTHGDDAKVLAGGQSLGPMLNMRLLHPAILVDINRIEALSHHEYPPEGMRIGALTRHSHLEDDTSLAVQQPLIAAALPFIAHRAIRNRGTIGGSLSHADPAAEWGALALALEVELVAQRAGQPARVIPANEFYRGLLTTELEPDELLIEIRAPAWPARYGWSFREFSRRHGDFALAGVAATLELDAAGNCREARIALIGVGDRPVRAVAAEQALRGAPAGPATFKAAAEAAGQEIDPFDDHHASSTYRRRLAAVLVEDALAESAQRARREN